MWGGASFVSKLNEADLGEFYLWMVTTYPYEEQKLGFGFVGPGDALRDVMTKLPQYPWLRLHFEEAEAIARANSWRPVSVVDFLALATGSRQTLC